MKTISILLAAAALGAAAPAAAQSGIPGDCALKVSFGSYAMGIDQSALVRTERLLKRDPGVRRTTSHRWGREGEVTLCATTRRPSDARRLFYRITRTLPRDPRGPVTVETRGGLRSVANRPMR